MFPRKNPAAVVKVSEVARVAGMPYRRMLRKLQAANRELHGAILAEHKVGKRVFYTTTWGALEQLHPQWFTRTESLREDVKELDTRQEQLDASFEEVVKTIGRLAQDIRDVRKRVERLEDFAFKPRLMVGT